MPVTYANTQVAKHYLLVSLDPDECYPLNDSRGHPSSRFSFGNLLVTFLIVEFEEAFMICGRYF